MIQYGHGFGHSSAPMAGPGLVPFANHGSTALETPGVPLCISTLSLIRGDAIAREQVIVNTNASKIVTEQQAIQQEPRQRRGRLQAIKTDQCEQLKIKQHNAPRMLEGKSSTAELSSAD